MFFSILKGYINHLLDMYYFDIPEPTDPIEEILELSEPHPQNVFSYKKKNEEFVEILII